MVAKVAVFGATGYTGQECIRILDKHPAFEIQVVTSESSAEKRLCDVTPLRNDRRLVTSQAALETLSEGAFALLCLPHGEAAKWAQALLTKGVRVIDLSADFRQEALTQVSDDPTKPLYGLCERNSPREAVSAKLVANPGCYPTSVLLPLIPLMLAGAVQARGLIVDSKSGSSGAGRSAKSHLLLAELASNLMPYSPGREHRHIPEMERFLGLYAGNQAHVTFTPHLLPVSRGLLSTIYADLNGSSWTKHDLLGIWKSHYGECPFVWILEDGLPHLGQVVGTNRCVMGLALADEKVVIVSAIDNLVKGAAGQAIQNLNRMAGLADTKGLEHLV